MNIAKGYQKHTNTGEMIYPCEMYQTTEENTKQTTEENKQQQTEQKADE